MIAQEAGDDVHVVLVLDGAGWHKAKNLQVPESMTLHFLPPYSPELMSMAASFSKIRLLRSCWRIHCQTRSAASDNKAH